MPERDLDGVRVAIIVDTDFEQSELTEPRKALDNAGATTRIVSTHSGTVTGRRHAEKGDEFKVDFTLEQAKPDEFDAIMLPGGALNADKLRVDSRAQDWVRKFDKEGKPLAVICHAPWLLVSAGIVRGRQMTSYHTIQDDLRNAGATWVDSEVVRDRNLVTSRQPSDIPAFNREMITLFKDAKARRMKAA